MTKDKLIILKQIYDMIKEYIKINNVKFVSLNKKINLALKDNLEIIEIDNNQVLPDVCFYGMTMIRVDKWINFSESVKIADINNYHVDYIAIKFKEKNKDLPLELIIYTFIHEMAHVLTIPEKHKIKHICKNTKKKLNKLQPFQKNSKKSLPLHHNTSFYLNLIILLRIAEKLNIYILPKEFGGYVYNKIIRFDSMINPEDNMSTGKTPLFYDYNK